LSRALRARSSTPTAAERLHANHPFEDAIFNGVVARALLCLLRAT
jgi:hypothetical protein